MYVEIPDQDIKFLCKSESNCRMEGFLWGNQENGAEACLLRSTLDNYKWSVKIEHYFKGWVLEYNSSLLFCLGLLSQKHRFIYSKDKLAQTIFNNKKLVRAERTKVLEYVLEKTTNKPGYQTDPLYFDMELYSQRWIFHPEKDAMKNRYRLIFESLVESGGLIKDVHAYKLSPRALNTISEYECSEQIHFDSQDGARKTRSLTKAIIVLGLLNLGFKYLNGRTNLKCCRSRNKLAWS